VRLSLDSVTGVSIGPLRLATWFGLFGSVVAFGLVCSAVVAEITTTTVPGWTSTMAAVAGFGAVQLLALGLLGEYVGRIYMTLQGRPTYFVAYDSLEEHEGNEDADSDEFSPQQDQGTWAPVLK
jgi:polyisoprenyl-phosphate glycosyltransferase